jgi:predicted small metal-binding protein
VGESAPGFQWQVTCPCGWRTHGEKAEVVTTVQEHGRTAHGQALSEQQVMELALPYGAA